MKVRLSVLCLLLALPLCAVALEPTATVKTMWNAGIPEIPEFDDTQRKWAVAVELVAPLDSTVHIKIETVGGTATPGSDYTPFSTVLEFPAGTTLAYTYMWVQGDVVDENDETIVIRATQEGALRWTHTATIADDDWSPGISITGDSVKESKGQTYATFKIRLSTSTKAPVSIAYKTVDGSATGGNDYQQATGTIVIPKGQTAYDLRIAVIGDTDIEADETFTVQLSNPSGGLLTSSSASATIVNDDFPPPPFTVSNESKVEGDHGPRGIGFSVTLGTASLTPVDVVVQTTGEGSATAGVDYEPLSRTITFAPGITQLDVAATILGDTVAEHDESFEVAVLEDGVVRATGALKIVDDDRDVKISIADASVTETDASQAKAELRVTLSRAALNVVRVTYITVAETAASYSDFFPVSGELVFAPGETSRTISVSIRPDLAREDEETFRVDLSAAREATIDDGIAVCTIVDDDGGRRRSTRH